MTNGGEKVVCQPLMGSFSAAARSHPPMRIQQLEWFGFFGQLDW
jgi:hypothetical protein